MPGNCHGGRLVLSILVPAAGGGAQGKLQRCVVQLLDLLGRHRMPATWALSDPACPLARRLVASGVHEVALLAEPRWTGRPIARQQFAGQLAKRVVCARAAAVQPVTLAVRGVDLHGQLDLIAKQQIRLICPDRPMASRIGRSGPLGIVRFGLRQLPAQFHVPAAGWFAHRLPCRLKSLQRATAAVGLVHVRVNALELATWPLSGLRRLRRFLSAAATLRDQGQLQVVTAAKLVASLSANRPHRGSTSILRKAA